MLLEKNLTDINLALGTGNVPELLYGRDAVNAMIENCLGIAPGERAWWPNFAVDLRTYLFKLITQGRVRSMQVQISAALTFALPWIPTRVQVTADLSNTYYDIVVMWTYNGQNGVFTTSLDSTGGSVVGLGGGTSAGSASGSTPTSPSAPPPVSTDSRPSAVFSTAVNSFTATITDLSTDIGSVIVSEHWDFGDGTTSDTIGNQAHTYSTAGTYTVSLIITDAQGNTSSATTTVGISVISDLQRSSAAQAAATGDISNGGQDFWGELDSPTGILWSGKFGTAAAPDDTTEMPVASVSKSIYVTRCAEALTLGSADWQLLTMTAGRDAMNGRKCLNGNTTAAINQTVDMCLNTAVTAPSKPYDTLNTSHIDKFSYDSASMQHHADFVAGLANLDRAQLAADYRTIFGLAVNTDLQFSSPLIAGGVQCPATTIRAICRGIVNGTLKIRDLLADGTFQPVPASLYFNTASPNTVIASPAPSGEAWYYKWGFWIEPTTGDYWMSGSFGFSAWIKKDFSMFGLVARQADTSGGEMGVVSIRTMQAIRDAWQTGTYTYVPQPFIALASNIPQSIPVNVPFSATVTATLRNGATGPVTISYDQLPPGLSLGATVDNLNGTFSAPLTGTPTAINSTTTNFTATNGTLTSLQLVTFMNVVA